MELLLVLVVGGAFVLLLRPLRDWYVVEVRDGSGLNVHKAPFNDLDAAQRAFDHAMATRSEAGGAGQIRLWHAEVRNRKEALKAIEAEYGAAKLLQSADL